MTGIEYCKQSVCTLNATKKNCVGWSLLMVLWCINVLRELQLGLEVSLFWWHTGSRTILCADLAWASYGWSESFLNIEKISVFFFSLTHYVTRIQLNLDIKSCVCSSLISISSCWFSRYSWINSLFHACGHLNFF